MPAADRCVEEIFGMSRRRSGTDDRRRRRIEVPPGVDDRLGTKAAHGENQKDDLHPGPEGLDPGARRRRGDGSARQSASETTTTAMMTACITRRCHTRRRSGAPSARRSRAGPAWGWRPVFWRPASWKPGILAVCVLRLAASRRHVARRRSSGYRCRSDGSSGCRRRIVVGRHPIDAFGGLHRDGSESESSDEDQFAHLKSPLLDERRLEKRFDPRCEAGHAGDAGGCERNGNEQRCARAAGAWRQ